MHHAESNLQEQYSPSPTKSSHCSSLEEQKRLHALSLGKPGQFWKQIEEGLGFHWEKQPSWDSDVCK